MSLYRHPKAKDCDPSPLALETRLFLFAALLFGLIAEDDEGSCKYIPLVGSSKNMFRTDTLLVPTCYDHLLPQIHNCMLREEDIGASSLRRQTLLRRRRSDSTGTAMSLALLFAVAVTGEEMS